MKKKKPRCDSTMTGNFQLLMNICTRFLTDLPDKSKKVIKIPNLQVASSASIHYLLNFPPVHLKLLPKSQLTLLAAFFPR